jgi:uncharacterized LabA/DUF88 family protein
MNRKTLLGNFGCVQGDFTLMTTRVNFYIDGFNVYFRLKEYKEKTGICYNWLDYKSLLTSLLKGGEELGDIYFFTAISQRHGAGSVVRHNKYITALEATGVKIIKGYFSKKSRKCKVRGCHFKGPREYPDEEEKETDVKIAVQMLKDAANDKFNRCFLMSGDNDFSPVLLAIKELCPKKQVGLITPPFEPRTVEIIKMSGLKQACKQCKAPQIKMTFSRLKGHSLPVKIEIPGKPPVEMPKGYQTF